MWTPPSPSRYPIKMLYASTLLLLSYLSSLSLTACTGQRPHFSLEQLYKLQRSIFDNTIAPDNVVNSTLLNKDVRGRVDITRQFTGIELNTEYLFGLFAQINSTRSFTLLGVPVSYDIVHFSGDRDIASAVTLMHFISDFWGPFTLELHVWSKFNCEGQVQQYEATFRHWDLFIEEHLERVAAERFNGSLSDTVAYAADNLAESICNVHGEHCTGADQQYDDPEACRRFLTKEIPFGRPHEMGLDTLLCRMVHYNMVPLRPSVHCPHIGPSGGDMCENGLKYGDRISQQFWEHPWVPERLSDGLQEQTEASKIDAYQP